MLQLRTLIKGSGELELSLTRVPIPDPKDDEILVRIDAAPINPSDIGLLTGPADISQAKQSGSGEETKVTAPVPAAAMERFAARLDQSMPAGNEGAGVVVKAGASAEAQALLGKTVALLGGAMYSEYRCVKASEVLLPLLDFSLSDFVLTCAGLLSSCVISSFLLPPSPPTPPIICFCSSANRHSRLLYFPKGQPRRTAHPHSSTRLRRCAS